MVLLKRIPWGPREMLAISLLTMHRLLPWVKMRLAFLLLFQMFLLSLLPCLRIRRFPAFLQRISMRAPVKSLTPALIGLWMSRAAHAITAPMSSNMFSIIRMRSFGFLLPVKMAAILLSPALATMCSIFLAVALPMGETHRFIAGMLRMLRFGISLRSLRLSMTDCTRSTLA